ncbi:hypothetical protein HMPREF9597_00097 [Cutibacterium acnes HL005PA4]|nr:hypothetical protein HMPREF0675_5331 [Cutibacterium acnes SK137]AEE73460.1 hypothetical protein PAZ_c23490 [Cutibacterium acnes 266]EFD02414.1 hypothetical protein HMPREF1034_0602 [Cutibacterium acnes SK187]EFD06854.1 hypothetical protein HMPREF9207_1787 [Cutibacterium acnes J165]EFS36498.1 hypothetical protein HMPREF9567_00773 [Cutibacterium acnes HL013PA1]EFS37564.1 hypothetical protein HMPREF9574_02149 [Cutibacterium acnes HL074PA1]EFS42133.1 hypothetical protein HMPREF9575_00012 [Cutib
MKSANFLDVETPDDDLPLHLRRYQRYQAELSVGLSLRLALTSQNITGTRVHK